MTVRSLSARLFRQAPGKAGLVVFLSLISAFTEGVGLLLLVPLLALAGLPIEEGVPGTLLRGVRGAMESAGLSFDLGVALLLFLSVMGVRALLQWQLTVATSSLEYGFSHSIRNRLYRATFSASWIALVRERIPELTHALTMDVERAGNSAVLLTRLLAYGAISAVYISLAFVLSPWITLVAISLGLALLLLGRRWNSRIRGVGEQFTRVGQDVSAAIQDHLGAMKTAKSHGAEERSVANFARQSRSLMDVSLATEKTFAAASGWMSFSAAAILCALVWGAVKILAIPVGALLLLILIFARVVPRVVSLQNAHHHLLNALPGLENVKELTERLEAAASRDVETIRNAGGATGSGAEKETGTDVRLEDVVFAYGEDMPSPVSGLSLSIPARLTTAIVGPSGGGKTTIADLVLGLLTPDHGEVLVDGARLSPDSLTAWRGRIGYVSQDGALLPDTVRANLLWANPEGTEEAMWEALEWAASEEFVRELPQGLDSMVGERGTLLSGGERQRLSLACALVRKPSLLVLDEATSALDAENERRILDTLNELRGEMTILLISHRLSAVRDADVIHVFHEGRIVESGSWSELMALRGRFYGTAVMQGVTSPE